MIWGIPYKSYSTFYNVVGEAYVLIPIIILGALADKCCFLIQYENELENFSFKKVSMRIYLKP